jgi:MarR family transcriptional regulator, temperature-dependent positive regulator of motility
VKRLTNPYRPRRENACTNGRMDDKQLSQLIRRCLQHADAIYVRQKRNRGISRKGNGGVITRQQLLVLSAIEQYGCPTLTSLVRITGIDRSTLTEMIQRMAARGYVEGSSSPHQVRAKAVSVTDLGLKELRRARALSDEADQLLLAGLSAAGRRKLLKLLAMLSRALEASTSTSSRRHRSHHIDRADL